MREPERGPGAGTVAAPRTDIERVGGRGAQRPGVAAYLCERHPLRLGPVCVVVASVLAAAGLAAIGMQGEIFLGDEPVHFRTAGRFAQTWHREPWDPLTAMPDRFDPLVLNGTPLWHAGLGLVWRLVGSESQAAAQAYQAGFYLLLLVSVYFGVRPVWGEAAASWAWLTAASMPMVCVYGILLYQDMPGAALSALALLLVWRRQFFWSGVCLAAAYFTKMNMIGFVPWAAALAAWLSEGPWHRRLRAAALVCLPGAATFAYDMAWRWEVYGGRMLGPSVDLGSLPPAVREMLGSQPQGFVLWKPYPFYDPKSVVSHLGVLGLLGAGAALLRARDRVSLWLWGCLALGVAGFYVVFARTGSPQMRLLFPAVLALIVLGGVGLRNLCLPRWLLVLGLLGCAVQAVVPPLYLDRLRHVPAAEKEAFEWIRQHTQPRQRIMYPERSLLVHADRPPIWTGLNPAFFMSEATDAQRLATLEFFKVSHVAIPLRRTYDRKVEGSHDGGYAIDFVEKARSLPYLEKVYENPGFLVFRVTHDPPPTAPGAASCPAAPPAPAAHARKAARIRGAACFTLNLPGALLRVI